MKEAMQYERQLHYTLQQLEKDVEQMEQNITDIENTIKDLEEISKIKEPTEMLAPIANGILIKATIAEIKTLKVNVGNGIFAEKTIPETIQILNKQKKGVEENQKYTITKMQKYSEMLQKEE